MSTEGIDISAAQHHAVDWPNLDPAIRFVVVKLTEGTGYEDHSAVSHCMGARGTGRTLGGYHYLRVRAGKPQDAKQQARDFAAVFERERCEFAALDVEQEGNGAAKSSEVLEAIHEFVAEWKAISPATLFAYTYPGFWQALGPRGYSAIDLASLPLWIAHYAPPSARVPMVPAPWSDWTLWQYAASAGVIGRVDGVSGMVDRNVYRGSYEELRRLLGLAAAPLPNLADDPRVRTR